MLNLFMKLFYEVLYLGMISSVVIILILLMKKLFARVLRPKWHYYIWLLLVIRLLLPFTPQSPLSAMNLLPNSGNLFSAFTQNITSLTGNAEYDKSSSGIDLPQGTSHNGQVIHNNSTPGTDKSSGGTVVPNGTLPEKSLEGNSTMRLSFSMIMTLIWLSGIILLLSYTLIINLVFAIKVKKNYIPSNNSRIKTLLEECKKNAGIRSNITIYTTTLNTTPSLYTSFHTKILVSEAHLEQLSNQEIKHIFLHELSHYKRKDITINWVVTLLQIVYFFQPLVWFAFRKMREDCEISCDAEALKYLEQEEYSCYGSTVIKLLRLFNGSKSNFLPSTAGFWKSKSNYRRRVLMITNFKKAKWPNTLFTVLLILLIGLIGMTGCQKTVKETEKDLNPSASGEIITSEPTASPTAVPTEAPTTTTEPTATPESNATGTSDSQEAYDLEYLNGLMGLSTEELIAKLGKEFTKVDEGGLEFPAPEIRVWFDDKGLVNQIYTNSSEIYFTGIKVGDTIDRFEAAFGKPLRDGDGVKLFQTKDYYLNVYYDKDKVFAVYLLSGEVAAPVPKEEASSAKSESEKAVIIKQKAARAAAVKAEASETRLVEKEGESYYGDWVIKGVAAYGAAGTYSKEDTKALIGKGMSFTESSASCFGDEATYIKKIAKKPVYTSTELTAKEFAANYNMTFDQLGITQKNVTQVTAADADGNGCTFLVIDENKLIVIGGGTFFELERK